jgi:iron complex outermembrane receptor protein
MTQLRHALLAGAGLLAPIAAAGPALAADAPTASNEIVVTGTRAQTAPSSIRWRRWMCWPKRFRARVPPNWAPRWPSRRLPSTFRARRHGWHRLDPPGHAARPLARSDAGADQRRARPCLGAAQRQRLGGGGAAAVDLNTIPRWRSQVEVLRDGASAQYGSDAIAGVVNLRLREADHGGGATVSYGQYETQFNGARSSRHIADGGTTTVGLWQGFKLGNNGGFLTVTGEYLDRATTGRSDLDTRDTPNVVRSRIGDPRVQQGTGYFNAALPLADGSDWQVFASGGYQFRDSNSYAFARNPSNANNVAAIYPDGFLPRINARSRDLTLTWGVRGSAGEWKLTFKGSYGRNRSTIARATRSTPPMAPPRRPASMTAR